MTRKRQVNNQNGAVLNREFPRRSRSLMIEVMDGLEAIEDIESMRLYGN